MEAKEKEFDYVRHEAENFIEGCRNNYTTLEMVTIFAKKYAKVYAKTQLDEAAENIKKIRDKPHHGFEKREKSYLKLGLNLAIEQLESITNTPLK